MSKWVATIERDDDGEPQRLVVGMAASQPGRQYTLTVDPDATAIYPRVDVQHGRDADPVSTGEQYTCPVCFYTLLERPPEDDLICPCCGVHFGYDDVGQTHAALGAMWRADRHQWRERALEAMKRDAEIVALVEDMMQQLTHWRAEASYFDESYEMTEADKETFVAPYRARLAALMRAAASAMERA